MSWQTTLGVTSSCQVSLILSCVWRDVFWIQMESSSLPLCFHCLPTGPSRPPLNRLWWLWVAEQLSLGMLQSQQAVCWIFLWRVGWVLFAGLFFFFNFELDAIFLKMVGDYQSSLKPSAVCTWQRWYILLLCNVEHQVSWRLGGVLHQIFNSKLVHWGSKAVTGGTNRCVLLQLSAVCVHWSGCIDNF